MRYRLAVDIDPHLLARLQVGEEEAQRIVFEQYYEVVHHHVLYKEARKYDADEITNETFFRAFRDAVKFRGESSFKTWLISLAKHAAVDFYRSPKNRSIAAPQIEDEEGPDVPAQPQALCTSPGHSVPNPLEKLLQKEEKQRFSQHLASLSKQHRDVIVFRLIDGLSTRETARLMGKTEGAVKMLLLRAMEQLGKHLKSDSYFTARGERG